MARHIEAWMDGVALSTVGPVLIRQVYEDPATMEIQTGDRPGRYGQRKLSAKRQSLTVAIECQIRELYNLAARSRVVEEIARWAHGSVLELSNHPGRRLHVYLSAEPALGEVRDYTSAVRIEFTADEIPYWEDATPEKTVLSGDDEEGTLAIHGTVPTPVSLVAAPTGTLTAFSVTAGGSTVSLTGISVASSATLIFERDPMDNLMIRSGSTVLLSKRSATSADDLLADPGSVEISFESDVSCEVTFTAKGRWA